MSIVSVSNQSEEFGQIERLLQVQLNAPQLKVSELLDLTSPNVDAAFFQYCKAIIPPNVVTAFVPLHQVSQSPTEIAARGLRVDPNTGLRFTLGSFEVDRSADSLDILVLTIAVGAVLNFQAAGLVKSDAATFLDTAPTHADVKPGYHTLCVSGTNDYVVFNAAQIKAGYLVKFAGGANLAEVTESDTLCDACRSQEATVWCLNDSAKLCAECDESSHKVNAVLSRHERLPISEARALIEFCPVHGKSRVEYYCPECRAPVCINCKLTGSHAKGPAASHALVPIKDAYAQALEATEAEDPTLARRKAIIAEKLEASDKLLDAVLANEVSVEAEIRKIAEDAIDQARKLASDKALAIRSVQTELNRKLGEIEALERSLLAHRKNSGPQAFLAAVDRQNTLVGALQDTADLPLDITQVHADLTVYGNLTVGGLRDAELSESSRGLAALIGPGDDALDGSGFQESSTTPIRKRGESGLAITSLALVAQRKVRRNRGVELTFQPFQRTKIITPEEGLTLYRCFPFKGQPQPHLLFSTIRDGRSIEKMHECIDGIGITVVIVQVGELKFGGFAASKWDSEGVPFGQDGCSFLFSLNRDAVIPFKVGTPDLYQLFGSPEAISFGKQDLVIAGNFDECASEIEGSYGVGFPEGSEEAKTFLAGAEKFAADQVEVWGFYTVD